MPCDHLCHFLDIKKKDCKKLFLLNFKMLPDFFHCPGAKQTHNKISLLMCWALLLAQTEQRKHGNVCPEAETHHRHKATNRGWGGGRRREGHLCLSATPGALRGAETAHMSPQPQSLELSLILMVSRLFHVTSHLGTVIRPRRVGPARSLCSPALHQPEETWADPGFQW